MLVRLQSLRNLTAKMSIQSRRLSDFKFILYSIKGKLLLLSSSIFICYIYIRYLLNVWDVGGQKSLRTYWKNYFESTDGLIWVIDSSDKMRINDCKAELNKLLEEERLLGATLLIFANKQDLPGSLSTEELSQLLDLNAIKTHHWKIVPCSAYTGDNLEVGINWLIDDISSRIFTFG